MTFIDAESNRRRITCIMVVAESDWMRIQNLPNRIGCGVKKTESTHLCRGKVSFLDRYQTQIFLAVTGLWGSGKGSLLASKMFSTVVATSHSSCFFLYLFSSANISPVRSVLYLQGWWCVGKRETSFPVNKLWLIYLPPSLWPITVK